MVWVGKEANISLWGLWYNSVFCCCGFYIWVNGRKWYVLYLYFALLSESVGNSPNVREPYWAGEGESLGSHHPFNSADFALWTSVKRGQPLPVVPTRVFAFPYQGSLVNLSWKEVFLLTPCCWNLTPRTHSDFSSMLFPFGFGQLGLSN